MSEIKRIHEKPENKMFKDHNNEMQSLKTVATSISETKNTTQMSMITCHTTSPPPDPSVRLLETSPHIAVESPPS